MLGIALMLGACARAPTASAPPASRPGMGIVFEGVAVRQYRVGAGNQVLQILAPRLQWDESQAVLEAPQGVRGTIDPSLWEGKMGRPP